MVTKTAGPFIGFVDETYGLKEGLGLQFIRPFLALTGKKNRNAYIKPLIRTRTGR
jgi:hypothetical protein